MVQQSLNVAYSDDSSQVLWEGGERVFSRGWRLDDNGNRLAVPLVAPAADHPSRLRLAIAVTSVLGKLHQPGLIHKDLKPANILANSAMDHVWLTGFGIASRLPRERQSPEAPEFIAGTLAYLAREQTRRMNPSIDARSDLYALGVTLYEM